MKPKSSNYECTVAESTIFAGFTQRVYDPMKGRLAATAAKQAFTNAVRQIGAKPGDVVMITITRKAG